MSRETFSSRLKLLATMIGVAVGLGNVWRFPYMVGRYGGAAFVLLYLLMALLIALPALMAEWTLGRHTRRGTVGAFERAGLPGGRFLGWLFFSALCAATAYYANAVGWVAFHGIAEALRPTGLPLRGAAILPPDRGFVASSFFTQLACTGVVVLSASLVLVKGLRAGIERASSVLTPLLFFSLLVIIARSVTLPGAGAGVEWYVLKFRLSDLTPIVALTALGQVVFSVGLGGTFMVVYGSYLNQSDSLGKNALWTVGGDTAAGLLAGLAIFPAVLALGLEPASGPDLIFVTLPRVFAEIPAGWAFGTLFFLALTGVAFLSAVAALEVLVAGVTDNLEVSRPTAIRRVAAIVLVLALLPMVNMRVFVPWDLTFGSGAQTAGVLVAVLAVGWSLKRGAVLKELACGSEGTAAVPYAGFLYLWIRWVIPAAILAVGGWWVLSDVLQVVTPR